MIPAFNETATISRVVSATACHGTCIVVDDGSSDATAQCARDAGAVIVSHPANRGYDAALETGFAHAAQAGYDVVLTVDADGQHDPGLVPRMLAEIADGADMVLGARNRRARLAEHMFAMYTRLRWGIVDPLCGMKAYRMDVYRCLGHFDSYRSIGTELMLHAARTDRPFRQIAFQVRDREGQPRFGSRLGANLKIMRALWLGATARYRGRCPCCRS